MNYVKTHRLVFRPIVQNDTQFIFDLYNTENFKKYVGDKKLKTLSDADNYISSTLNTSIDDPFGMKIIETYSGVPVGICGLVNRRSLDGIDIGYGLHPQFEGNGYAYEAATETMKYAKQTLKITELLAITTSDNIKCIKLLSKIGFNFDGVKERINESTVMNLYSIKL